MFENGQDDRVRLIKEGKDPDSMESVFEIVATNLQETIEMVKKDAKERGIDLENIDDSDHEEAPPPETFPLYRLAKRFSVKTQKVCEDLILVPIEADEKLIIENAEVIAFYLHLIPVKVYRALSSSWEDKREDLGLEINDDKTSAFIAVNGLLSTAEALGKLARHKPLRAMGVKLIQLSKIAINLAETIDLEFNLGVI